ncbi:MAG: LysM domain-containing protein [Veillonellaceae bacterium]|nr:LysM domain-containing protein [Veillonellaceae bacterium]
MTEFQRRIEARQIRIARSDASIRPHIKKGIAIATLAGAAILFGGYYDGDQVLIEDTYTVRPGDTFWDISETFLKKNTGGRRYILEFQEGIKELNPWLQDTHCQIQPGDKLRINYFIKKEADDK